MKNAFLICQAIAEDFKSLQLVIFTVIRNVTNLDF